MNTETYEMLLLSLTEKGDKLRHDAAAVPSSIPYCLGLSAGELKSFPNAQIFVNEEELSADELQGISNLVPVKFTDGAYTISPKARRLRTAYILSRRKVIQTETVLSSWKMTDFSI